MKLTEKDIRIYDTVFGDEVLGINIKHSKEKFEQLKQQILENQEKANKWDEKKDPNATAQTIPSPN